MDEVRAMIVKRMEQAMVPEQAYRPGGKIGREYEELRDRQVALSRLTDHADEGFTRVHARANNYARMAYEEMLANTRTDDPDLNRLMLGLLAAQAPLLGKGITSNLMTLESGLAELTQRIMERQEKKGWFR